MRNQIADRNLDAHGFAEIADEHALHPIEILNGERLIEPIFPPDLLNDFGIALLAGHHQSRIAGQELLQREDDHGHEEQRRDQLQQALAEEGKHGGATGDYLT